MKKGISIILSIALALSMLASVALIETNTNYADPVILKSILVTDAAGYAAPYAAVESAMVYVENQAAFVVIAVEIKPASEDDHIGILDGDGIPDFEFPLPLLPPSNHFTTNRVITVNSSTLDLSIAKQTSKYLYVNPDGAITAPLDDSIYYTYDSAKNELTIALADLVQDDDGVNKYFFSFAAITKPATLGEIKATLPGVPMQFTQVIEDDELEFPISWLKVYSNNELKYIINAWGVHPSFLDFQVFDAKGKPLIDYINTLPEDMPGAKFEHINVYGDDPIGSRCVFSANYLGRIVYKDMEGNDVDVTDLVNEVNAFFGFSFANADYPVKHTYFEAKTVGNPTVVKDTYLYLTAVINDNDVDVAVAETGDFSVSVLIAMVISAFVASAALAFTLNKARNE